MQMLITIKEHTNGNKKSLENTRNSIVGIIVLFCLLLEVFCGEVQLLRVKEEIREEITTPPPPPKPYAFGYAAGRYPGHIDRTHSEVSDGSGVVQVTQLELFEQTLTPIYEVCKLSNETGNVAPDLATLRRRDLEGRYVNM
ncbi:hypothetical protein NQ318_016511 [Aromia moschata]|uniref:Uncharacterized protein n=1 Tax=Aromia moschata TaxID=1265417 RepID=A0AAV8YVJ0_9CUCU|nr:hypothetical protein NQ318_016511 [Aromia moschata]